MNKSFLRAFVCVTVRDCMVKGGGLFLFWWGKALLFLIYIYYYYFTFFCQSSRLPTFLEWLARVYFESCWLNKHHWEASEPWGSQERPAAAAAAACY